MQRYVTRRATTANLYFRRAVPPRLRASLGKREIVVSLGTPDRREAERLARQHAVDTDGLFQLHERLVRNGGNAFPDETRDLTRPLRPSLIPTLVSLYQDSMVATHLEHPPTRDELRELREWYRQLEEELTDAAVLQETDPIEEAGKAFMESEGYNPALTAPDVLQTYLLNLLHADLQAIRVQLQHLHGTPMSKPTERRAQLEGDNWEAMLACWKTVRAPGAKTWDETRQLVSRFQAFAGDIPLTDITPELCEGFRDHLLAEGLSPSRVKTILALLRPVVNTAIELKKCSLVSNPFAAVKVQVPKRQAGKETRQPFELDHLQTLFYSPVYRDGVRPKKGGGDAAFWLPLLSLYSGARAEELGQLHVSDILMRDGQLYMRITTLGEDQGLKNAASHRSVPVHNELLKIGFANYVEFRRQQGEERLFPDLRADRYGNYTKMFSTWCNMYIDQHVVDDKRYTFHSFRHCFEEYAGWSGLTQYQIDGILGHTPGGMAQHYGKKTGNRRTFNPRVLAEGMAQYRVDHLDLSHLYGCY